MSELVLAAAVLGASLALTYFFCLPPTRRGFCARVPNARASGQTAAAVERDAEIASCAKRSLRGRRQLQARLI